MVERSSSRAESDAVTALMEERRGAEAVEER